MIVLPSSDHDGVRSPTQFVRELLQARAIRIDHAELEIDATASCHEHEAFAIKLTMERAPLRRWWLAGPAGHGRLRHHEEFRRRIVGAIRTRVRRRSPGVDNRPSVRRPVGIVFDQFGVFVRLRGLVRCSRKSLTFMMKMSLSGAGAPGSIRIGGAPPPADA